ncbi:hypothetical protein EP18_14110 [Lysinibacillus sphaericus]|nr:hypothetical protein [Lysinibacillus sphaericus]KEK10213.1 hypothetical protein EP18_18740 [Lysinibacillus sphaericus]KEK11104.1 hypothetical protein EP18_14110 [Lysinibacillus sphaericus]
MINNISIYSPHLLGETSDPLFQQIESQSIGSTFTVGYFTIERCENWFDVKSSEIHELFHTVKETYDFLKNFSFQ